MGSKRDELLKKYASNSNSAVKTNENGNKESGTTQNTSGKSSSVREKMLAKYSPRQDSSAIDDDYISKFFSDVNDYFGRARSDYNGISYSTVNSAYDSHNKEISDLFGRSRAIRSYLRDNRGSYSKEDYDQFNTQLYKINTALSEYSDAFSNAKKQMSKFGSEEEYNTARKNYEWQQKYKDSSIEDLRKLTLDDEEEQKWVKSYIQYLDDEEKGSYDLVAGQKEIDDLEAERQRILDEKKSRNAGANGRPYAVGQQDAPDFDSFTTGYGITNNRPYAVGQQAQKEETPEDTRLREIDQLISKKKQYLNQAKHIQEINAYDDTVKNADFDQYDDYAESDDTLYNWINNLQFRESYEASYQSIPNPNARRSKYTRKGYDRMYASEIAIFNYYYAKSGKEAAQKYLDTIQERLNERIAEEMYIAVKDDVAAELVFGAAAGLSQFGTDVKNFFNTEDDYIAQTAYQLAGGKVREDLADNSIGLWYNIQEKKWEDKILGSSLGQIAYDTISTAANMAPSILASYAVGAAAGTLGLSAKTAQAVGSYTGSAMMGISAAGGAYQQALNEGYDKNQARGYSILVGASEMAMERLLGGISAVGGNALGRNAVKNIANADTALKAIGLRIGGSALSEFGEEYLQEVLDPVFSNIMLKTDKEVKLISAEAIYSGILGMLTGAIMESPSAIYGEAQTASAGRKLKEAGGVDSLAKIGNTFAADTVAYKLAGKVNENTGAYTIGQLLKEVGATLTEQNVNEIAEVLMQTGNFDESTAKENAQVLAAVVAGAELSRRDVAIIESNDALADAARKVLIDQNTTWNQRTQGYNEVLRKLAMDKVTGKKSAKAAPSNDQQMTGKLTAEESTAVENADESRAETAAAPRVKEIVSMKNGTMKLRLEDGSVVDSGDASYSSDSEALVYETVAKMTNDAEVANVLIDSFHIHNKKSALDAQMYAAGIDEAFRYGKSNIPRAELASSEFASKLTPAQQEFVYRMGQRSAGKQVAKNKATVKKSAKNTKEKTAGKVHFDRKGRTFDKTRETSLKTMEQLAAVLGTEFYVYESYVNEDGQRVYKDADGNEASAPNGFYDPETGAIHIDLNAGAEGNGTMIFTVAHELTHFIKHWSDDKFKVLANFLVKQYGEKDVSVSELVQKQIDKAKRNGRNLEWDEAYEEMVADSMESMLTDGNVVQMMADLKQQDKTLWQKICDWFKNLAGDLKELVEAYKGYKPDSPEGKMVADMQDTIVILESIYADALAEASENFQRAEKNTTEDGGVKMQTRSVNGEQVVWIEDNVLKENKGLPVHQFIANYIAEHIGEVYTIIESGQKVYIGDDLPGEYTQSKYTQTILKSNSSISRAKNRASANLGEMIEIATNRRWEKTNHPRSKDAKYGMYRYDTQFGFPVKNPKGDVIGANIYDAELLIRNASDGKKYLYDIVSIKKNTANSAWLTQRVTSAAGFSAVQKGDVSKNSIRNNGNNVNKKFSDRDYMDAVNRGDMRTAQRMVDVAAQNAGYTIEGYHGTKSDFWTFSLVNRGRNGEKLGVGYYFTNDKEKATLFSEKNGNVKHVFLDIKKPTSHELMTISQKEWGKFLDYAERHRDEYIDSVWKGNSINKEFEIRDMLYYDNDAELIKAFIDSTAGRNSTVAEGYLKMLKDSIGYDGLIYENGDTKVYVAFTPEQIKSADPVTHDDGNVIPLSERFNKKNPDIRYSARDSDGRQLSNGQQEFFKDSQARDENGNLVTVYHSSPTAGFYKFDGGKGEGHYKYGNSKAVVTFFTDRKEMADTYARDNKMVDTTRNGRIKDGIEDIKQKITGKSAPRYAGQYRGYANIKKPYIVDAEGRNWDDVRSVFRQEKYDSFVSITDKEKAAVMKLWDMAGQDQDWFNTLCEMFYEEAGHSKKKSDSEKQGYKMLKNSVAWKTAKNSIGNSKSLVVSAVRKAGGSDALTFGVVNDFDADTIRDYFTEQQTTNDVVMDALKEGIYDGVIIRNVVDYSNHTTPAELIPGNLYITFSSEQFKAWDNTDPTKSKDMRYSDRDPAAGRVNEVLQNENAKLKEDVQYLKDLVKLQNTVTGGKKFTKTSVEAMAGNLMKANNVKGNKQELAKLLNDLYEYIAKGEELSWDGVKEMAQPAVDWLRKNTVIKSELSQYAREILHDVRTSRISLDESQTAEAAYRYGSYNDYRKAIMGSVIISKDGVPLDIQWQEWASTYPDIFDANITASDMPNALADAISSLRNSDLSRAEYAYHADMIEQDLLQQVYDGYWRVSTLYTVADVKQREINALKGKHRQKMNDLRQFHREKTDQLKQEHRDEVKRIRKEYREDSQKKQQEIIQRYQDSRKRSVENRNKTAMRHKIQNVVKELNSLLLTNDKKRRVPDNLKKAVAAALDLVNMDTVDAENRAAKYADLIAKEQSKANPDQDKIDSYTMTMENILRQGEKMGQRIKELHAAYEEIQNSDDPDIANAYDPVISGAIQELSATIGNTSIKNMTMEQLSDVYDVYRAVLTRVRDANKAMAENIRASIEELAKSTIREVQTVGGSKKYRVSNLDAVRKFDWNNLKPVYAMERIGSSTLTDVFNNVRAGEDTWAKDVSEAREYYLEKSKKYGYDKWDFDKKYRFESNSGIPFELTLEQILSLYAYSKREQAADHLRLGGFVFDSNIETYQEKDGKKSLLKYKVNTADAHQITPEIMADIIGKLSKEQIGFVDEMQDYLSTVMGAKGNEVTSKMYGVKLFKEKFYFPLKSAKQFMFEQNEVSGEVRIKNSGFTNKVVAKANNPVILSNFMDVWSGHVNDMSMYHAFTLPLEDFNRVFNYNSPKKDGVEPVSVKGTIQDAYSPAAVSYVKQLITDLNGGARTDSTTGVINKLTGMFKKGAVFASLSVVVQQPSAIARTAALVDTKYFIGPKVDKKRHKYLWAEVKKYAPVAIIKEMGYFDTNMGKSTQDFITGKEYSGIGEKAKAVVTDSAYRDELLSKAPALADEYAWCGIWAAVKRETKANHPSMDTTSEAFLKLCGKRFTEVITKTQVYDSVLARSANMRSEDTGMKMATAFMAEPTTSINMIEDAIWKAKRGDKKYAGKAIGAVIASQILNAILVSFVYAGRDDDEDETYAEKYIGALTGSLADGLNAATYIPFIKDIVSIMQGYDVERSDMAVVSDLWNAWKNLKNDKVSPYRNVENFAGSIAQIFGLPVKNIMRDVRGIYNTITNLAGAEQTTGSGVKYAIGGAITGKTVSDKEQLYKARLDGDKQHAARVAARYDDEDSADAAVRAAIKDSFMAEEIDEATAVKHMVLYAGMDGSEAHWTMDAWKYRKKVGSDEGYGKYGKFHDAVRSGKNLESVIKEYTDNGVKTSTLTGEITEEFKPVYLEASNSEKAAMKTKLISAYVACDMEREDAEKKLESWDFEAEYGFAYSDRKETYLSGKVSKATLVDILIDRGYDEEDAEAQVEAYEWEAAGFEDVTTSAIRSYNEWCEPVGIPKSVYLEFWRFDNSTENDVDKTTGKPISYSAVKKIMAYINSLNLTDRQKDALAKSTGWADKTIKKYKLW